MDVRDENCVFMMRLSPTEKLISTEILKNAPVGQLGLNDASGYPRVIPLNFVFVGEHIFFHGGTHGEKYSLFAYTPKVTFSVDVPYALIPSYWVDSERACAITQFFKSVLIRGRGQLIKNQHEKLRALQAIMEKYQPERRFSPLELTSSVYAKAFERVAIFRIDIEDISVKYNFGQRLEPSKLDQILTKITQRNTTNDRATILEIHKWRSIQTA